MPLSYSKQLVNWHIPKRNLRSKNAYEVAVPVNVRNKRNFADRAFVNIAPKLWNDLPLLIRSSQSLESFNNRLKTHLFRIAYDS